MPGPHHTNTIIIGGGAAGLACAVSLTRAGIPYIVLEKNQAGGQSWSERYHRLHLHTPRNGSALPYLPMPRHYPTYVSKDDLARYLELYAATFDVTPRFNQRVMKAERENDFWRVSTDKQTYSSDHLIIATGLAGKPRQCVWKGLESFKGTHLHSSEYTSGEKFANKRVLVVGFGNSACEIALCLHEHNALPAISVRGCVNILPRDIAGIPIVNIATFENWLTTVSPRLADAINKPVLRIVNGRISKYGLRECSYGPLTQITKNKKIPLLDIGTLSLIRAGKLKVYPDISEVGADHVKFIDGRKEQFDTIVFATGYDPCFGDFLVDTKSVSDDNGMPLVSGEESALRGLFFCGFRVSPTGMLRQIGIEARKISSKIQNSRFKS